MGVGVRLGKMGVLLGVIVALSGELSPKFSRGSIVAPGGGGVNVAGTLMATASSTAGGREIGATKVGRTVCSPQAAWVSSKNKQHRSRNLPDLVTGIGGMIPLDFGLCQH